MTRRLCLIAIMSTLLLLNGCVNQGVQQVSRDMDNWTLIGKMSIRQAEQASSFDIQWRQKNSAFEIELSGPLGQGAVQIRGQPGYVKMTQGDNIWQATTLTELAQQSSQFDLPLEYLQYWIKAKPAPQQTAQQVRSTDNNQLLQLQQAGWVVIYPLYFSEASDALPKRIEFVRGDIGGRLIIRNWIMGQD